MHIECRRLLEGRVQERRARAQAHAHAHAHAHQRGRHGTVTRTAQNSRKTILRGPRGWNGATSKWAGKLVSGRVGRVGTLRFDGVAGEGRDVCEMGQHSLVGVPDQGERDSKYSPGPGASPDSTLGGKTSEEPVLFILASSLSTRSVGIWKACQSKRAEIQQHQPQQQQHQHQHQERKHYRGRLAGCLDSRAGERKIEVTM